MSADLRKKNERRQPPEASATLRKQKLRFSISRKNLECPKEESVTVPEETASITPDLKKQLNKQRIQAELDRLAQEERERAEEERRLNYEKLSSEEKKEYRRNEAIKELIETEQSYVEDLRVVIEVYISGLKTKAIIDPKTTKVIFSNIEMIYHINLEFTKAFKDERNKAPQEQRFGAKFLELVEYLKAYTQYCSDQDRSLQMIRSLRTNPDFSKFLEESQRNPRSKGGTLLSYLIKPIQRLCKYPLLLKQIQTYLSSEHLDYNNISVGIEKVEKVVAQVNESKNKIENVMKIMEIQNNIEGAEHLVQPGRRYLKDGTIQAPSKKTNKLKEKYLFLFSDLLVLCKFANAKKKSNFLYQLKSYIPLKGCHIEELKELEDVYQLNPLNDEEYQFKVPESVRLCLKTGTNKEWLNSINECILENTPEPLSLEVLESSSIPIPVSIVTSPEPVVGRLPVQTKSVVGPASPRPGPGHNTLQRPTGNKTVKQKFATVKLYSRSDSSTLSPLPANNSASTNSLNPSMRVSLPPQTSPGPPSSTTTATTSTTTPSSPPSSKLANQTLSPTIRKSPLALHSSEGETGTRTATGTTQTSPGPTSAPVWQFRTISQRDLGGTQRSFLLGAYDSSRTSSISTTSSIFTFSTSSILESTNQLPSLGSTSLGELAQQSSSTTFGNKQLQQQGSGEQDGLSPRGFVPANLPAKQHLSLNQASRDTFRSVTQSCPMIGFKPNANSAPTEKTEATESPKEGSSSPLNPARQRILKTSQKSATMKTHSSGGV